MMTNIRRRYLPNRPVFITAVCHRRTPFLESPASKDLLLAVMREVKSETGFSMLAYAIPDDHFHWLIEPASSDFSKIMQSVKLRFVHRFKKQAGIEGSYRIWQNRFWDHVIRNEDDLYRHLDYIHYNPVKHGFTNSPQDYPWCSFKQHVEKGNYHPDWGRLEVPDTISGMNFE